MRPLRILALVAGLTAFAMLVASGPVTRAGIWPWQVGLRLFSWAAYAGLAAAGLGLILSLLAAVPRWREGAWMPVAALVLGIVAAAPPLLLLQKARAVPAIHDITTDPFDPPNFVALLPLRLAMPNGANYGGGAIAAKQQQGYPDIKSLILKEPPGEAVQHAIDAARACGWEIAASDARTGRIEATDTTSWFGFKDDIVVRVRPEASGGSRVDVRSASRVGVSDVGANAARVREFLSRLK
ncbi:MAG TPA: DUF1499 domain-containing protein [Usitatibacter sp.]|jgi:hypothetical protein|nr:DUF1499 domain-containing protein [Usitatibacter sp.]